MKKILYFFVFYSLIGCSTYHKTIKNYDFSKSDKFLYVEPMYMIPEEIEFKDLYNNYKNKTKKTIDSLFYVESKKYRIVDKLKLNFSYDQDIKNLFLSIKNDSIYIPENLKSNINTSNKNILFISITPKASYLHGVIPIISNSYVETAIIRNNSLIFYDKSSSGSTLNKGYRRNLLKDLDKIYSNIKL